MNTADRVRRRSYRQAGLTQVQVQVEKHPHIAYWDNVLRLRWERLFPEAQA